MATNKFLLMHDSGNKVVRFQKDHVAVSELKAEAGKVFPNLLVQKLQVWDNEFEEYVDAEEGEQVAPKSRLKVIANQIIPTTIFLNAESVLVDQDHLKQPTQSEVEDNLASGSEALLTPTKSAAVSSGIGWLTNFTFPELPEALHTKLSTGDVLTPTNETTLTDIIVEAVRPYTIYPTSKQYGSIVESLFRKYPSFANSHKDMSLENQNRLWVEKLKYKFQNTRRRDPALKASLEVKSRKRKNETSGSSSMVKVKNAKYPPMFGMDNYLPHREASEDDTSIESHIKWLQNEFKKKRPDYAESSNRLHLTLADRRKEIVEKKTPIHLIQKRYPWLFTEHEILAEFHRIHGSSTCAELLQEGLKKHAKTLLLCYKSKKQNSDSAGLLPYLQDMKYNDEEAKDAVANAAILSVPTLLREDWKKIFHHQGNSDNINDSAIFLEMDEEKPVNSKEFTLLVDGNEVCSVADLLSAIACYIAAFYVFHLEYPPGLCKTLEFYQYALLNIRDACSVEKGVLQLVSRLSKANSHEL